MKGILIDTLNKEMKVVDCESELRDWYKLLNCDLVEMPEYQIEGKYFTFICDEEGLLKSNPVISAVDANDKPMLVGNILIYNSDYENGDVADLTDSDIELIQKHIKQMLFVNTKTGEVEPLTVLTGIEY